MQIMINHDFVNTWGNININVSIATLSVHTTGKR